MARTDDDSWEITESVGATALGVAAARAAETESEHPLFRDPFARVFLDAAGEGMWTGFDRSALADVDPGLAARMQAMVDFFASRTAFIDDFFAAAADAGIRQVVILAAGLDARAWRLAWPHGTRVYELDQPKVLEFKSSTLREHGAKPTAQRIEVPVDLRQDWPTALRQAGSTRGQPPPGRPRGCCGICRRARRICSSSASTRSAVWEAGSSSMPPPMTCWTRNVWRGNGS
jgi:methyltransferase (TIGR00027 family)